LFSYVSPEARVPANHPLRKVRALVRDVSSDLNRGLSKLYATEGRPSVPPEQLLSDEDWETIEGINDPANRRGVIAARVLLRIGLSRASEHAVEPSAWRFRVASQGRRSVAEGLPRINFSISHIDPLVLVAILLTLDVDVDVDVEWVMSRCIEMAKQLTAG
jgi:phosphopantetheinyl transferase